MRGLVVKQPWAGLIEAGLKTVELRCWSTKYRGPVRVCAGAAPWSREAVAEWGDGPRGVELCDVELVDVRPATAADMEAACVLRGEVSPEGLFAWIFERPAPVERRAIKGKLGLFTLPPR